MSQDKITGKAQYAMDCFNKEFYKLIWIFTFNEFVFEWYVFEINKFIFECYVIERVYDFTRGDKRTVNFVK